MEDRKRTSSLAMVSACFVAMAIGTELQAAHEGLAKPDAMQSDSIPASHSDVYVSERTAPGVTVLATEGVDEQYLDIAIEVYRHMTSRAQPIDLRALHAESGFKILLITEDQRFSALPEFEGQGTEIDEASGLGGCIGEFLIGVRVGSPHVLVHELGHGIYHSAIQFQETNGARDEEAWHRKRVQKVHGMDLERAIEKLGGQMIHEVLLAEEGTFSARLAAAWRNADQNGIWHGRYAGTEPNEYWAEGVTLFFNASSEFGGDQRAMLLERDSMLHALCASIFPNDRWAPQDAVRAVGATVPFTDDHHTHQHEHDGAAFDHDAINVLTMFHWLDRDRDGSVGRYEGAEALMLLVDAADTDEDGALSADELKRFVMDEQTAHRNEQSEIFREVDADQSGRITKDECPDEMLGMFESADANRDGALSADEFAALDLDDPRMMLDLEVQSIFDALDDDGDDEIRIADVPREIGAELNEVDRNDDGRLSRAEVTQFLEAEFEGARFQVNGEHAVMTGIIGPSTPGRVLELMLEHPSVTTIVMQDVPGSMDDVANLRAARFVRRCGLATHVPDDGMVASGGTDFFQAGLRRTAGEGARFGVHSWGGFDEEGADLPASHPEHEKYLAYYRDMGIPEDFYWYTLKAAPADDIHWMTREEIVRYNMLTDGHGESRADDTADDDAVPAQDLIGGAVQPQPTQEVPDNVRAVGQVQRTALAPFRNELTSCGIRLVAEEGVSDDFLVRIGHVIAEMFPALDGVDEAKQTEVLSHLHAYGALLPVPRTERSLERLFAQDERAFLRLHEQFSLCDIIMQEVADEQRVMEVVEHVLHTVTDVGLHYAYPDEWGLSRDSALWAAMQRAIEHGHYDVGGYHELEGAPEDVRDRILMQEFAYWFITTAWDLQTSYGPVEDEWTVRRPETLRRQFPEFHDIFDRTVGRVMQAPSRASLRAIGPARDDHRR